VGMPEQKPQVGMNIAPDGTIYEVLEDGTIRRIGKVSSNGEFEPFGGPKEGSWNCPKCGLVVFSQIKAFRARLEYKFGRWSDSSQQ